MEIRPLSCWFGGYHLFVVADPQPRFIKLGLTLILVLECYVYIYIYVYIYMNIPWCLDLFIWSPISLDYYSDIGYGDIVAWGRHNNSCKSIDTTDMYLYVILCVCIYIYTHISVLQSFLFQPAMYICMHDNTYKHI